MAFSIIVMNILWIAKAQYRIAMQDIIFKAKNFEVTHKSMKSVKSFSLEMFRLYCTRASTGPI